MRMNVQGGHNEEIERSSRTHVLLKICFGPYTTYLKYDRPFQSH